MKRSLFILLIIVPFIYSCRESISVELEQEENKVVILSEISPEEGVKLHLSVTADIFSVDGVQRPNDARIFLSGTDLAAEATAFIYSSKSNQYELRNKDFRPSAGESYTLSVELPDPDFEGVSLAATTTIPMPVSVSRAKVVQKEEIANGNGLVDLVFDIEIELEEVINEDNYLHILPERIFSQYKIDDQGEVRITFFAETEPLQVLSILDARNAVSELTHREGIFVDNAKLGSNIIKLRLSTTTLLDPNIDILENMELTVSTLSKELYEYHQSLHKQLINSTTSFTSPTTSYSNIENGLGVFGGMSTTNSLIKL